MYTQGKGDIYMPKKRKPNLDYRKNNCRFSRVEDALIEVLEKVSDETSKNIVIEIRNKLVKEEIKKFEARQKRGK